MRQIWVLEPVSVDERRDVKGYDPWSSDYNVVNRFVIRAESKDEARQIAQENGRRETTGSAFDDEGDEVWTDSKIVTCVPFDEYVGKLEGDVLMSDYSMA